MGTQMEIPKSAASSRTERPDDTKGSVKWNQRPKPATNVSVCEQSLLQENHPRGFAKIEHTISRGRIGEES